jgi:hypothetical protein
MTNLSDVARRVLAPEEEILGTAFVGERIFLCNRGYGE